MRCDALLVGAGTLRREGYRAIRLDGRRRAWRTAHGLAEHPTLVVLSGALALDPAHPALAGAPVRPVILTHRSAPADRRTALEPVADILTYGDTAVDLRAAVDALHERGHEQILSEGGPHVMGALTAADLVDELCLTISPLLVGPGAGRITAGAQPVDNAVRTMKLRHVVTAGDVLILRYDRT
jgi:riboflavin biosynthesis pyrimidine reductase